MPDYSTTRPPYCMVVQLCNSLLPQEMEVEVPNIPHIPSKGVHRVPFVPNEIFIERSDFKEVCLWVHVQCDVAFHSL